MTNELDGMLAAWAAQRPEILTLFVFGSRARGDAQADSDLDLAFELDDSLETQFTVLVVNRGQWQRELSDLTGQIVRDLYLLDNSVVTGPIKQVYSRVPSEIDLLSSYLKKKNSRLRTANSYWYWPDKPVAERGAATKILAEAGFVVERLVSCADGNLPPDCAATVDGVHAGIEVTELVHEKALAKSINNSRSWWFVWDQRTFAERIQRIIDDKDRDVPRWQGGPYSRRVLVVHTDETYLDHERVNGFLRGQRFSTTFFSEVVLGLPYDPFTQSHPTYRLSLDTV